ncbi:hypothetical protein JQX08_16300 [Pseudomonas sp. UL073]|uniref:DUF4175 domain-containing protein n=1 Tax=Zestomonas insulae TaxID=2809017 RepID=A0ABS2IJC5_9GAMM|nr:hypothetical protein [Pseudomonas insulae]MBM7062273.1 hypothetical protein [Pseudomonas insulae]
MKRQNLWRVFAVPLAIALLGFAGLFAALLGDGAWDALAWLGLGLAAVLGYRALLPRRGPRG